MKNVFLYKAMCCFDFSAKKQYFSDWSKNITCSRFWIEEIGFGFDLEGKSESNISTKDFMIFLNNSEMDLLFPILSKTLTLIRTFESRSGIAAFLPLL